MTRTILAAALLCAPALAPAMADEAEHTILAYDRLANIVVMRDRSVYELPAELMVPADMKSGDRVRVVYQSAGEDGITKIDSLERI